MPATATARKTAKELRKLRAELEQYSDEALLVLRQRMQWRQIARRKQLPPDDNTWDFFGVKSGRGFGKTLAAARWISDAACCDPGSYNFVIAPTHEDLIKVCFEGPTGLMGKYQDPVTKQWYPVIHPSLIRSYKKSPYPIITLYNGAVIMGFSAEKPNRLRGPQCHRAWCDEVASWKYPEEVWDNLIFGLRLGEHPQIFWTGTPKPKPFIRMLVQQPRSVVVSGSTYENAENLADVTYENIAKYEGTKIGRQEIYGEVIDPEEAGFVKRSQFRLWRQPKLPKFRFIVLSLDTAFTEETWNEKDQTGDPTAGTVWGLFSHEGKDHIMLLDAWEDYLGFPQLIQRVREAKLRTYGDADEPIYRPAIISKARRPSHTGRPPDLILIEDKGSGISLRQMLAVESILTESYNPGDLDKLSRLHAVSPLFPHGRVWVLESMKPERKGQPRDWCEPVIAQMCTYVGEGSLKNDDLLDTATQALLLLMHKFNFKFTHRPDSAEVAAAAARKLNRSQKRNPYDGYGYRKAA